MRSEGFRWKRSHEQQDQVLMVLWNVILKTINIVRAFEGYWAICRIILLLVSWSTLHVVLKDTCANGAHHAHSSGGWNCNRCLNGIQLQLMAGCALRLMQAVGSHLPHFWVGLHFPGSRDSVQSFFRNKKLLIVEARGLGVEVCLELLHIASTFLVLENNCFCNIGCWQTNFGERDCCCSQPFLQSKCTDFWFLLVSSGVLDFSRICVLLPCLNCESVVRPVRLSQQI